MPSVLIIAKPYDAEVMRSALVSAGFSASVWDMISDPVERLQDERPDAVILALQLPGRSGVPVLDAVRALSHGNDVPIVLVTDSSSEVSTLGDAVRLGADQLLLRPVNPSQLLAKLGAVLDLDTPEPPPIRPASTLIPPPRTGELRLSNTSTSGFASDSSPLPRWRTPTQALGTSPTPKQALEAPPTLPETTLPPMTGPGRTPTVRGEGAPPAMNEGDDDEDTLFIDEQPRVRSVHPEAQRRVGLARELQAEIDAIDRRLFPNAPAPFSLVDEGDDELDTLDDIDVERMGVDTFPGARRPRPTSRTLAPAPRVQRETAASLPRDADVYRAPPSRADLDDDQDTREHDTAEEHTRLGEVDNDETVGQGMSIAAEALAAGGTLTDHVSTRGRKRRRALTGPVAPSRRRRRRRLTEGRTFSDDDADDVQDGTLPPTPVPLPSSRPRREAALHDEAPLPLVAVELAGDLRSTTFAQLLDQVRRSGFSGRLDLAHDGMHKSVHFEEGQPVFAGSNEPQDRLAELLLREGKITREQHTECEQLVGRTGRRLGAILVEKGLLKAQELFPLVRRHVAEILYSLFAWTDGRYELKPQEPPEEKIRLEQHPAALVAEGVRRKMGMQRLLEAVGGHGVAVVIPSDALSRLEQIELTAAERAVISRFTGDETLGELVARGLADELTVMQSAFIVIALGLGNVRGQRGAQVGSLDRAREVAIDRQRLETKYAQVCEADYFSLLGLRSDASGHEVLRAYERVRAEFEPATFPPDLVAEHAERISEIVYVIDEAFRVLSDDMLRAAYRETL
ncbi:MAG: DUF4388 domain-containing protein [Myxococcales bacterium]|nr:DUF4388 domain-containing protein [Myxococcales bacterium]